MYRKRFSVMGYIPEAVGMSVMAALPGAMLGSIVAAELWRRYQTRKFIDRTIADAIVQ